MKSCGVCISAAAPLKAKAKRVRDRGRDMIELGNKLESGGSALTKEGKQEQVSWSVNLFCLLQACMLSV